MQILIVAPRSNLPALAEFISAAEGNNPEVLHGTVPIAHVVSRMASGQFDAVHFIAHGDESALHMSDGDMDIQHVQNAITLAAYAGKAIRLIVLNACRSVSIAAELRRMPNGPEFTIGWRDDVPNDVAIQFATRFYQQIRVGDEIDEAYEKARRVIERREDNAEAPILLQATSYVPPSPLFRSPETMSERPSGREPSPHSEETPALIYWRLKNVEKQQDALFDEMRTNQRLVLAEMHEIRTDVAKFQRDTAQLRIIFIMMSVFILMLVLGLAVIFFISVK